MKNITVSLDDELYRKSRVAAAEADTSVTGLVREFLLHFTGSKPNGDSSERIMNVIEKMRKRHPGFCPGSRMSRDEIHSR